MSSTARGAHVVPAREDSLRIGRCLLLRIVVSGTRRQGSSDARQILLVAHAERDMMHASEDAEGLVGVVQPQGNLLDGAAYANAGGESTLAGVRHVANPQSERVKKAVLGAEIQPFSEVPRMARLDQEHHGVIS